METIQTQRILPPTELLSPVQVPDVPDCKKDSCVASFIVLQNQALQSCVLKMDTLRKWASN